ncbi:MAG: carboxy terminal-processing peptidase [Opitutales bacterium]|nr:carboxy terminal-processing peptidase [Opitutales bacterium]
MKFGKFYRKILKAAAAFLLAGLSSGASLAESPRGSSAILAEAEPAQLVVSPKIREESKNFIYCLENGHFLKKDLSKIDMKKLVREYMGTLDFMKMFFLESDVEFYEDMLAPLLPNLLKQGVILPANKIYHETFVPRANARLEWIKARMQQPFDFSKDESFRPDRSKADWPKDMAAADELWDKRIKFDVLSQIIGYDNAEDQIASELDDGSPRQSAKEKPAEKSAAPKTYEEKLEKAKEEVLKRYESLISNATKDDATEIQELFLNALSNLYDPHTSFLSEYTLEEFDISVRNALVGIGAVLSEKEGYCSVVELMPGGPAEKCKEIEPGDKIVGVGQSESEIEDVIGKKLRNTVRLIRGKEGTTVYLQIEPKGNPGVRKIVVLKREKIQLTEKLARAYIYELPIGGRVEPIGVIDLPAFYGENDGADGVKGFSTTKDVEELILKLKERGVKGIILDLRKNGGGFLNEAVDLAGLFIRTGPVLQVCKRTGSVEQLRDDDPKVVWDGPLVVLVSRLSASAAEIVAGALKNHERAVIVGDTTTFGKGSVQAIYHLAAFGRNQKGAAKITIQKWYQPNGESIQLKGIHSDIALPSTLEHLDLGEDKRETALGWDEIPPASIRAGYGYGYGEGSQKLLSSLSKKSGARRGSMEEFKFLNDRIDWFKNRVEKKDWSLNLKERERELKADEAFLDSMKERQKELAKSNYQKEEILLNSALEKKKLAESAEAAAAENKSAESKKESEKVSQKSGVKAGETPQELEPEDDGDVESSDVLVESKPKIVSEKPKKDDVPEFDVPLREALRIMGDWLEFDATAKKN